MRRLALTSVAGTVAVGLCMLVMVTNVVGLCMVMVRSMELKAVHHADSPLALVPLAHSHAAGFPDAEDGDAEETHQAGRHQQVEKQDDREDVEALSASDTAQVRVRSVGVLGPNAGPHQRQAGHRCRDDQRSGTVQHGGPRGGEESGVQAGSAHADVAVEADQDQGVNGRVIAEEQHKPVKTAVVHVDDGLVPQREVQQPHRHDVGDDHHVR